MPTISSTSLRVTYRGTWVSGSAYRINDVVYYSGASFIGIAASTGKTPTTEPTFWGPLAKSTNALDYGDVIMWGADPLSDLYRPQAGYVKTDGSFAVATNLYTNHGAASQSGFGACGPQGQMGLQLYETYLYRDSVKQLKTDGNLVVAGGTVTADSNQGNGGQFTVNQAVNSGGGAGVNWQIAASNVWSEYMAGNNDKNLYLRDQVNGRMQVVYSPGTASALGLTELGSDVRVDGTLTVSGAATFAKPLAALSDIYGTSGYVSSGETGTAQGIFEACSAGGPTGVYFREGSTPRWRLYMSGLNSPLYVRDMTNARMQVTYTPGSSATTASTGFSSNVVVEGNETVNGTLAVAGGAQMSSLNVTNGVQAGSSTSGSGVFTVDSNNGLAGLSVRDKGIAKWTIATTGTDQPLLIIDSVNNRGQLTFVGGATDTTASSVFNSNVTVKGNETVNGTLSVTGGITGVNTTNGAPAGGTTGQVLAKASATDYATQWVAAGWTPVVKSGTYQANAGEYVLVDSTSQAVVITSPASPVNGQTFAVRKTSATSTNDVYVYGGFFVIEAVSTSTTLPTLRRAHEGMEFVYDATNTVWRQRGGTAAMDALLATRYSTNTWYDRRSFMSSGATVVNSTLSPSASTIYYMPLYMFAAVRFDMFGYLVASVAPTSGASVRLGLYSNVLGVPAALVSDFGLFSLGTATTTALKLSVSGAGNTLPKGWSWLAMSFNGTAAGTTTGFSPLNTPPVPSVGIPEATFTYNNALQGLAPSYYTQNGDAAASALATAPGSLTSSYGAVAPNLFWRVSQIG